MFPFAKVSLAYSRTEPFTAVSAAVPYRDQFAFDGTGCIYHLAPVNLLPACSVMAFMMNKCSANLIKRPTPSISRLTVMSRPSSLSLETIYHPGAVFQLFKQQPPTLPIPLSNNLKSLLSRDDRKLEQTRGRLYNCYRHNIPIPPNSSPALSVTLASPLSAGIRERPTQVWKVSSGSGPNGSHSEPTLVARFYDPFYYNDPKGEIDPFIDIDRSTAIEPEAYRRLQPVQGSLVPKFHGLFLCRIPSQLRNVYVILLDYVRGVDLASLHSRALCADHKNAITDEVVQVISRLHFLGVEHHDITPGNLILLPSNSAGPPAAGHEYCKIATCPLRSTVDVQTVRIAAIDLGEVDLDEDPYWDPEELKQQLVAKKEYMPTWWGEMDIEDDDLDDVKKLERDLKELERERERERERENDIS